MTTTSTATSEITLPLGTSPHGTPVSWHLTDQAGRPQHGLIVGPMGSGGSTTLAALCSAARHSTAEVTPTVVDLDHGPDHYDPVWEHTLPRALCTTTGDLLTGLPQAVATTPPAGVGPALLLVDGDRALRTAPDEWQRLIRAADAVNVCVIARVYSLRAADLGGTALRQALLGQGQYLALGRPTGAGVLAETMLPGYTAPTTRQSPGTGVYGHHGQTVPVHVTTPDHT